MKPEVWRAVWLCAGAYVLGSFPTGLLVGKAAGIDVRTVGSGNIGATNVARALGKKWAVFVLVCDALKGFLPVAAAKALCPGRPAVVALAGLATIVGHMFTIFLRGRGGKGVATSLGVSLGLSAPIGLACLGIYLLTYAVTRLSSLGSLLGIWSFPVIATIHGGMALPLPYRALSVVVALLVTLRHRANIGRLLRREESRVEAKIKE